jgi:hypothetical protein
MFTGTQLEPDRLTPSRPPFWLLCAALLYPLYWAATFVLRAAPAFIQLAWFGHRLVSYESNVRGASAASIPTPITDNFLPNLRQIERDPLQVTVPLVLVLIGVLSLVPRRWRGISGLSVGILGVVGASSWLGRWVFLGAVTLKAVFALLFFFAVLGLGLHWLAGAGPAGSFGSRARSLLTAFFLPLSLLILLLGRRFAVEVTAMQLGFCSAAVLIASLFAPKSQEGRLQPSWKIIMASITASLCLFAFFKVSGRISDEPRSRAWMPALSATEKEWASRPYAKLFFQKGVNFTAEWPDTYSSEGALQMLARLAQCGVNAVALVPYGFTRRGSAEVRFGAGWETDEGVAQTAAFAHSLGMKVMLKPQVWVRPGYPGDLEFDVDRERRRWFDDYWRFLEHYARLAVRIHADLLCVGVEFARLSRYETEWRGLIARTRQLYPGPLVYAANSGTEFETVRFWDALDYIGLDNYYSLPDDLNTQDVVAKVEAVQEKFRRPVIFTEAGFSSLESPHRQPWDETPRRPSSEEQARCYEALFRAFYCKPWFQGVYWWKVGSDGHGGLQDAGHTPWGKPAMEVVSRWYRSKER